MVPEMEKPSITEVKVRMDCNGCVNKIKKALHGISGIYDIYFDFSQQKIIVTGWADPQKLVKAIKKARKTAIICLHTEQSDQPEEPAPEAGTPDGGAPPPESTDPPVEPIQTEATQPKEAPTEQPHPENPPPEESSTSESSNGATTGQSAQPPMRKYREDVHVIHHHPPDYGYQYPYGPNFQQGYSSQWIGPHGDPVYQGELFRPPQPTYATHSYNTYKPLPCVTEHAYPHSLLRYGHYSDQSMGLHGDPGLQGEPFQPPRPVYPTRSGNTYKPSPYVTEYAYPCSPPRYPHYSDQSKRLHGDQGLRGEPSQPPRPVYPTQSDNTYKPSPYVTEHAYPHSPPRYSHCSRQRNGLHHDPGHRGEPSQPSQPIYPTQSDNMYKPSPYVTEYAYPHSPPRHTHYSGQGNENQGDPGIQGEPLRPPQPVYTTHNYNTYNSSPYVTEYAYPRSPPRYSHYSRLGHYREDYYYSENNGNGDITSMFSDENPNACRII